MADEKTVIRSLITPTIPLDDLVLDDLFEGSSNKIETAARGEKTGKQSHKELGTGYPFININNYIFKQSEIVKFELDATGFIPKVLLQVALINQSVFKTNMPKDGDIMSLFIRAKNDAFKPIRNDYLIKRVDIGKGGQEGAGSDIIMEGELFIPRLYDEIVKVYKGSSYTALQEICKQIGLGFATNETSTDDAQNWICSSDNLSNMIKYISKYAWKDEKSFYKAYIDVYYHLNFININNQLEGEGKVTAAILDVGISENSSGKENAEQGSQKQSEKILTDMQNYSGTNMFIKTYTVQNNSSIVSQKWGYKSHAQFYDQKSQEYWDIFVDPIVSEGAANDKILLKGRPYPKKADGVTGSEDYWQTQIKKFWLGIQYKDVHDKFLYAGLWNDRNNEETKKMYLEVDVDSWNPNIYRGEKLPLFFLVSNDSMKRQLDATPGEVDGGSPDGGSPVMDQLLSGFYMVDGIKFTYVSPAPELPGDGEKKESPVISLSETFYLTRREWPVPATG